MSYFENSYASLKYPLAADGKVGFRQSQIAAAHAVSAHFFNDAQPAIVTMPTGAGKTTVLMAVAFMLRAKRVLVLTPSRLVREQIAENFKVLADLKKIEALPLDLATPRVFATEHTITSLAEWEALRAYDVVVATVPSVSPRDGAIPEPPADLFDLVLVDEAHHAPARTWSRLLNLLQQARQVLFTATPFRRDEKEIKGKFVFSYDLRRAYADKVFGDITFEPVRQNDATSIDIAIAKATEARFRADRTANLNHMVMVRTDTLPRAKELIEIYETSTALRLAFVSGNHSLGHVKKVIAKLKSNELDGIVCVNMFGEGFNLPNLKIAAVHSPHKSLAVTLQFIGRFARTGQRDIGGATFLAEPNSSHSELQELYEAGAIWRDIIQNLSGARVEEEVRTREVLDSFEIDASPDMDDFSLYTVRPYFHAKVFATPDGVDFTAEPDFPDRLQVIYKGISDPNGAAVYLTREAIRSPWSTDERFTNVAYDLFIFHHNVQAGLLFICASRRDAQLYTRLARTLLNGRPRQLSHSAISRALNDLEGAEFFSVGMRRRHKLGRIESYRMIAGPSADRAIQDTDGRQFDRGHCFGKAIDEGSEVTIGVSTASKVWSNTYDQIPELLNWCDRIAVKIASGRSTATGSRLDLLSSGEELTSVPPGVIGMSWGLGAFKEMLEVFYHTEDGAFQTKALLDLDLTILESADGFVRFGIGNEDIQWTGIFSIGNGEMFAPASAGEPDLVVHVGNEDVAIADYLNEALPSFFCTDLSAIEGNSLYKVPADLQPIGDDCFEAINWAGAAVDIMKEKPNGQQPSSIFEWLQARLIASDAEVVFCDDGSGEMADFIAVSHSAAETRVSLYHCKASGAAQPGNRVVDLYDVCGQAVKSCIWMRPDQMLDRLRYRATLPSIRKYLKGGEPDAARLLASEHRQQVQFDVYIVQPGVLKLNREIALSNLLAATQDYLVQGGVDRFGVIGS